MFIKAFRKIATWRHVLLSVIIAVVLLQRDSSVYASSKVLGSNRDLYNESFIEILVKGTINSTDIGKGNVQAVRQFNNSSKLLKGFKVIRVKREFLQSVLKGIERNPKVQAYYINVPFRFHWQQVGNKDYPRDFPNYLNPTSSYGWYLEKIGMPLVWHTWQCATNPATCGEFNNPVLIALIDTGLATAGTSDNPLQASFTYNNECTDSNNDGTYTEDECLLPITTPGSLNFDLSFVRSSELSSESIWNNPNPGANSLCNDLNGADVDIYLFNQTNNINPNCSNANRQKEGIPADDYGHGTSVAHVIVSQVDNADPTNPIGIAPKVKLVPIKVNTPFRGWFYLDRLIYAIEYAADIGADIINISAGTYYDNNLLRNAIEYAANKDVLIVASAGNSGQAQAAYPAAYATYYDNVIAVGATSVSDTRAFYSNYIPGQTVYAPVGEDSSTVNNSVLTQTLSCSITDSCVPQYDSASGAFKYNYNSFSTSRVLGTSFAAPQVSAAAAILKNSAPYATSRELKEIIYQTLGSGDILNVSKLVSVSPLVEFDKIAVNSNWRHVNFTKTFTIPPKLFVTRSSLFGLDPVYIRIKNVTSTGFDVKLQENKFYDGKHKYEEISFLALQVSDSAYELGTLYLDHNWTYVKFRNPHSTNVHVIANVVSYNGADPVTVDIKDVSSTGFYIRLQEPAGYDGIHIAEKVNWVAFDGNISNSDSGVVSVNNNFTEVLFNKTFQGLPIVIAHVQTENGEDPVILNIDNLTSTGFSLRVAEDPRVKDDLHTNETIFWLAFDYNNTSIKKGANFIDHNKVEVRFGKPLSCQPVVFAFANTKNGAQPFDIYVESVTRVGFFTKLIEDKVWDGKHMKEKIVWFAVCPNDSEIATTTAQVNSRYLSVALSKTYTEAPYVLATNITHNTRPYFIYQQISNVSNDSITLRLGENPRIWGDNHGNETVAILSFLNLTNYVANKIQANHSWKTVSFEDKGNVPFVFAQIISRNGLDPVKVNIKEVTTNSFKIRLEEDSKTYDGLHTYETVNYLIIWP